MKLTGMIKIDEMSQDILSVVSEFSRIEALEPKNKVTEKYRMRVVNGVIKGRANVTFEIFVSKFSDKTCWIPRKTVLE